MAFGNLVALCWQVGHGIYLNGQDHGENIVVSCVRLAHGQGIWDCKLVP
jgi:hypothetical protein